MPVGPPCLRHELLLRSLVNAPSRAALLIVTFSTLATTTVVEQRTVVWNTNKLGDASILDFSGADTIGPVDGHEPNHEHGSRRRGGPRRRRGVTSIIGEYGFEGAIEPATSSNWRPIFSDGHGLGRSLHLNNPSIGLIDVQKSKLRFHSKNSFLELPQVHEALFAYTIMFDFFYVRRTGHTGHSLLQFAAPENHGLPLMTTGLGFAVNTKHQLIYKDSSGQQTTVSESVRNKWVHVGLTAMHPCREGGRVKVYVDGEEKVNTGLRNHSFNVCGKVPFLNFDCQKGSRGGRCTAQLEVKFDNLWTIEDYANKADIEELVSIDEQQRIKGDPVAGPSADLIVHNVQHRPRVILPQGERVEHARPAPLATQGQNATEGQTAKSSAFKQGMVLFLASVASASLMTCWS